MILAFNELKITNLTASWERKYLTQLAALSFLFLHEIPFLSRIWTILIHRLLTGCSKPHKMDASIEDGCAGTEVGLSIP